MDILLIIQIKKYILIIYIVRCILLRNALQMCIINWIRNYNLNLLPQCSDNIYLTTFSIVFILSTITTQFWMLFLIVLKKFIIQNHLILLKVKIIWLKTVNILQCWCIAVCINNRYLCFLNCLCLLIIYRMCRTRSKPVYEYTLDIGSLFISPLLSKYEAEESLIAPHILSLSFLFQITFQLCDQICQNQRPLCGYGMSILSQ